MTGQAGRASGREPGVDDQVVGSEEAAHLAARVRERLDDLAQRFEQRDWIELAEPGLCAAGRGGRADDRGRGRAGDRRGEVLGLAGARLGGQRSWRRGHPGPPAPGLPEARRAAERFRDADEAATEARQANQTGDDFVLVAVVMAMAFFVGGLAFVLSLPQNVGL